MSDLRGGKCSGDRGVALMTVLLLALPLVMIVAAALAIVGHGTFTSLTYQDRLEAFYAAESGVVYAMEQIEAAPIEEDWVPPSGEVDMPNGRASFVFGDSVNNLTESLPADGPRGTATVPPDTVELIVTGRAGVAERTLQVIIGRRGAISVEDAILASGRVELSGNIQIMGVKDVDDWTETDAGLHSNLDVDDPTVVNWTGASGSGASSISGNVSAVSNNPNAIHVSGQVDGDLINDDAPRLVKKFDIPNEIALHTSAPSPPPVDANGEVVLQDGDFYVTGPYNPGGKLVLDNANLYVSGGGLEVTGAVVGKGSLYVQGTTTIYGDAKLSSNVGAIGPDVGVGVFSTGDVTISGFNGDAYMNNMVAGLPHNDPVALAWSDSQRAVDELSTMIRDNQWDGFDQSTKDEFDSTRRVLGQSLPNPLPPWASGQGQLRVLADALELEPPSLERDFLIEKFRFEADKYDSGGAFYPGSSQQTAEAAIQAYATTGDSRAIVDSALDMFYDGVPHPLDDTFRAAAAMVEQLSFRGLGDSYFQGVIYSEGDILIENQLTLVGGIITNGHGSQPGDVTLTGGATIIFPEDAFKHGRGAGGTGQLGVKAWISR